MISELQNLIQFVQNAVEISAPGETVAVLIAVLLPVVTIIYSVLIGKMKAVKHCAIGGLLVIAAMVLVWQLDITLPFHRESGGWFWSPSQTSALYLSISSFFSVILSIITVKLAQRFRKSKS